MTVFNRRVFNESLVGIVVVPLNIGFAYSCCRVESARQANGPNALGTAAFELASAGSPAGSVSIGQSPISSPQPSFYSSHKSVRSSGRGSGHKKRRTHSPGHTSSGSEDTVRVSLICQQSSGIHTALFSLQPNQCHSASSLASSVSTLGAHSSRLQHAEVGVAGCG